MKNFFLTKSSEYDSKHINKAKVYVNKGFSMHSEPSIELIYCSLGNCNEFLAPCTSGCPYAHRENATYNSYEYLIQYFIMELNDELTKQEMLVKFINNTFTEDERQQVVECLAHYVSSSVLEKIRELNPAVVKDAMSLLIQKSKEQEKVWKRNYVKAKIIGEYLFVDLVGLPDVKLGGKKYWFSNSFKGSWIKISDIDSHFLRRIRQPDFINSDKEKREEYNLQIEALMDFLEEKLQLITMLELTES